MRATIPYEPCAITKRARARGHEAACGCPACNRAEFARRSAWQRKHGTLDGYTSTASLEAASDEAPPEPEQSADLLLRLELKTAGDGIVEGYGSVFGVRDSHDDAVVQGAFARSLRARQPAMLWQHHYDHPVGIWTTVREDDYGLRVHGQITLDSTAGRDAYALITSGACTGLSIGFRTVKAAFDEAAKTRRLLDIDLHEISFVTFPACHAARVSRKGAPLPTAQSLDERLDSLLARTTALTQSLSRPASQPVRAVRHARTRSTRYAAPRPSSRPIDTTQLRAAQAAAHLSRAQQTW